MNQKQRELFSDKAMDLGHVIFGTLVVGQFLAKEPMSAKLTAVGLVILVATYAVAYLLLKGGE